MRGDPEAEAKRIAFALATRVHGNTKAVPKPQPVNWQAIIQKVTRVRPAFTVETLAYNVALSPRKFKAIFKKLPRKADFPENLLSVYAEAYTANTLPNASPWRDYLLTIDEAETAYRSATKKPIYRFRQAVRDGEIPCYRFTRSTRRFRPDDIKAFIGIL